MDVGDITCCDVLKASISWLWESRTPSEPWFCWMPDHHCPECYECSLKFTLLNRRHHCRLCGHIFCSDCSSNRVPSRQNKIRVCNFCFLHWKQTVSPHNSNDHGVWMEQNSDGECRGIELVHYEENGLLWLPPEPEYEEDKYGDEEATGDFGENSDRSKTGKADYRSREEQKTSAMIKNVFYGHLQASVAQQLRANNVPVIDSWLQIITTLSWEAATLLKLDTQMDPRAYVKVKSLASGHPIWRSMELFAQKIVAHKRMASKIEKPRLLIFRGALDYHQTSKTDLFSFQDVNRINIAVGEIDEHRPDILLVEKYVSRDVQDYLLQRRMSFVVNIKRPLLEHIARCTGGSIISSIDDLSSNSFGYCDSYHIEKFVEQYGPSAGQSKTSMFFQGCPIPKGCTVLLRGASEDELKKVKRAVKNGVFTAYHLAREICFLADEGACLSSQDQLNLSTREETGQQTLQYSLSNQESILVSLSSRSLWTGTVCLPPRLLRIRYYGKFNISLGRILKDPLVDQHLRTCSLCGMPREAHADCYSCEKGTVTVLVKKLEERFLPAGERDGEIWTWHSCMKCTRINDGFPAVRKRVVMSRAALDMSFGRYLEISLSDTTSCGHSLHRHCLRFYGVGKMVACFGCADINSWWLPCTW